MGPLEQSGKEIIRSRDGERERRRESKMAEGRLGNK